MKGMVEMKKFINKSAKIMVSLIMIVAVIALSLSVASAADKNDSGNMPKAFFTKSYWGVAEDNTAVFELADGSIKFSREFTKDLGSFKNSGFETMFKITSGFELTLRANEAASEGYVFGIDGPSNISQHSNRNFYIRKADNSTHLAGTVTVPEDFSYGKWAKLAVNFNDKGGKTEIEFKINNVKLDFILNINNTDPAISDLFKNIKVENGNLVDSSPVSTSNSFIKVRPYYNGGFESSPNKDNQVYFASVDLLDKVTKGNFVTKIAVVGDSITQGVGATDYNSTSYVAHLQKKLGANYDVYNCGASANTAMNGTYQTYTTQVIYYSSLLFNPDFVIFALGTNDGQSSYWDHLYYYGPATDSDEVKWRTVEVEKDSSGKYIGAAKNAADGSVLSQTTVKNGVVSYYFKTVDGKYHTYTLTDAEPKFINQAGAIIDSYAGNNYHKNAHAKTIISSVMHTWSDNANTWNRQENAFNAQKKLAEENKNIIGIIDNYTFTGKYTDNYREFSDDGLHPNDRGHLTLANNIYEYLKTVDLTTPDKAITIEKEEVPVESVAESKPESKAEVSSEIASSDVEPEDNGYTLYIILGVVGAAVIAAVVIIIVAKSRSSKAAKAVDEQPNETESKTDEK